MVYIQCTLKHFPLLILLKLMTCFIFLQSPCSSKPCQNNGTCLPQYDKDSYLCVCKTRYRGKHCQKCRGTFSVYNIHTNSLQLRHMEKQMISRIVSLSKNRFWLNRHSRCAIGFLHWAQTIRKKKETITYSLNIYYNLTVVAVSIHNC